MKDMRLALVQHNSHLGKTPQNLNTTESWVRKAAAKDADLVCLPELGITAHGGDPSMIRDAQPVPGGPAVKRLSKLAVELGLYICAGIAEEDRRATYNTQFVVGPEGFVGKQRKIHLSKDEYFFFRAGTQTPVLDLSFVKLGLIICFDNIFPEVARCLAIKGAELLLGPHAARCGPWPRTAERRRKLVQHYKQRCKLIHRCRALDNGVFVGLCNTAGRSAMGIKGVEANHAGGCMAIEPNGEVLAESRSRDIADDMVVVDLKADRLEQARERVCFPLRARRVEAFGALTEATV